ncbi:MAG: protein-L-isoaspartate(D-aspartate) O-methyltransferase [Hyphomicrobiaceae bacterium]
MEGARTPFSEARLALVEQIRLKADELPRALRDAIFWPGVLEQIGSVPREKFVHRDDCGMAYHNVPLSIGFEQTISQPLIVAVMTGLLQPRPAHKILEVGTGSGYQAAVLARLVASVHSIEIVPQLACCARHALELCNIENVTVRVGDGHSGLPQEAPFDGIIVTAASRELPETLLAQLKPSGRMVLPLGYENQMLSLVTRSDGGAGANVRALLPVRFVPFVS